MASVGRIVAVGALAVFPKASSRMGAFPKARRVMSSMSLCPGLLNLKRQGLQAARSPSRARQACKQRAAVAMINVDLSPSSVLGSGMVLAGLSLWQLRSSKPEISKDGDVVFSSMSVLVGGILIFQGWRLDPLLLFGQLLTVSVALSFALESISLRRDLMEKDRGMYLGAPGEQQQWQEQEQQWQQGSMRPLPPPSATRFSNWEEPWEVERGGGRPDERGRYNDDDPAYDAYYAYEGEEAQRQAGGTAPVRGQTAGWDEGSAWQDDGAEWQSGSQQSPPQPRPPQADKGDPKGRWGSSRGRVDMLDDWDA